jgi:hypothetical protein
MPLMVERGEDARRERRLTAALHELYQRVKVDGAIARQLFRELRAEARAPEPSAAPPSDGGGLARRRVGFACDVHVSLAPPPGRFLPRADVVDIPRDDRGDG